jgi:ketosteroid isomerase-like protein
MAAITFGLGRTGGVMATTMAPKTTPEVEIRKEHRSRLLWEALAILGIVVIAAGLIWFFFVRDGVSIDDEIAELDQLILDQEAAQNAQNEDAMLEMLAPDVVLHWADVPVVVGRQGLQGVYANLWPVFESIDLTVTGTTVADDATMAWMHGTHVMELNLPDAGRISQPGKWTTILEKIDGEWLVTSLNIAPVAPPA